MDDTFWHGTLSEGAVSAVKENIELVTTLAKRGIISSICSKNDYEAAKHRLQEMGVWNMFVFPSISWSAKGESVKHIIDAAQLRAPNVLFIDDNTSNIAEVEHFNPGINTMLATANLSTILNSEALKGKNDSSLSRLKQYKILEQKAKFRQICTDNSEFLRRSDIRIEFIYDTQSLEDRIIELANRSNQLNYTKRRFSEGEHLPDAANIEQAAVHVVDNFGDYGICGYYAVEHNTGSDSNTRDKLLHFFFSCRALNLGIENYV